MRDKATYLKDMIKKLEQQGRKAPVWGAVAEELNRPRRRRRAVNIADLAGVEAKEIVVPGSVLSEGELGKALTVAAIRFSAEAQRKIEKAGGKALSIPALAEKNPTGTGVRLMK